MPYWFEYNKYETIIWFLVTSTSPRGPPDESHPATPAGTPESITAYCSSRIALFGRSPTPRNCSAGSKWSRNLKAVTMPCIEREYSSHTFT